MMNDNDETLIDENDEILMSQLADGELSSDRANEVLLGVLDAPARREKLKAMLTLRQATACWRTRQPHRPVMVVAKRSRGFRHAPIAWRVGAMAAAACIGGLLVLTGIWAAGRLGTPRTDGQRQTASHTDLPPIATQVSLEQMQQVAKVFALHESVAGPLAWYAADDQNIRLASATGADAGQQPIGVLLRLKSAGGTGIGPVSPSTGSDRREGEETRGQDAHAAQTHGRDAHATAVRTLVIVCRNDQPAVIELPGGSSDRAGLRLYLTPRTVNGKVDVQYAIAMEGQSQQAPLASLSGQRSLGLANAQLGQLAMGDRVLNIEAAAWPMRQEHQ
jgi:hypothetical protein